MKVSASFLSSKNPPLDISKLNDTDVDYIHVDVIDGEFAPKKTMPFSEMRQIYKYTNKRLDIHLMCNYPSKFIKNYSELSCEYISFHIESKEDITKNIELIHDYGIKAGLVLSPNTKVSTLIPYLPFIDLILVMSVEPGIGGQKFIDGTDKKIDEIRNLINEYNLNIVINVDGGINDVSVYNCKKADIVTSGSFILNSDNFQDQINKLRI